MNIINVKIDFEQGICRNKGISVVTGDYNSTKVVFDFVENIEEESAVTRKVFEMKNPSGELVYADEIVNNEVVLVGYEEENGEEVPYSLFGEVGDYTFEVSLYGEDSKLTSACGYITAKEEQIIVDGEVVETQITLFDNLMQELTENLNVLANKQDTLVSGTNIKTINNESILGSGDIHIEGGSGGTSDYEELENKPSINNIGLIGNKSLSDLGIQAEGNYALRNEIPTNLSQLTDDTNHRLTTDSEKTTWNNKSDFSGDYDDLTNKPTIPTVPTNVSAFTNDVGYLTSETDPVFSSSVAHNITSSDVSNWNSKQAELVSGTNIKTINNESILGSGNITIEGGGGSEEYAMVNYSSLDTTTLAEAVDREYQKFCNGEPYHIYYQGTSNIANVLIPLYFYYQFASQPMLAGFLPTRLTSSSKKVWAMVYVYSTVSDNHITRVWNIDARNMNLLDGNYDLITTGNTVQYSVSGDYNPAHKKYVDDKPTTWDGYDATKTQVLKNINGTITWEHVDLTDYYTKTETDTLLNGKVNNSTLNSYYTKTETGTLLNAKVNTSSFVYDSTTQTLSITM